MPIGLKCSIAADSFHDYGLLLLLLCLQEVTVDNGWDSAGFTTYRVYITLDDGQHAKNCYSIFGQSNNAMLVPPARQVPAPFGTDVGGVSPAISAIPGHEDSKYDSWLTVGVDDGNPGNTISSIGIDFGDWSVTNGITVDDGAVFWMNPDDAPDGRQLVAQLTLPSTGESAQSSQNRKFTFSAQGRMASAHNAKPDDAKGNWKLYGISAQLGGKVEPPVDCEGDWGDWGKCNVCGEHGQKQRTYSVTQPAANGGQDCPFKDRATQSTACKSDELPCPPTVVPHFAIRCHTQDNTVTTTLVRTPGAIASTGQAIFDFVLESAQSVTISNQLPKDCPSLSLFAGTNISAVPLIKTEQKGCGQYTPLKATLEAGNYTVVATTPVHRETQVRLTTMCREPTEPVLNPRSSSVEKPTVHHGDPELGSDVNKPNKSTTRPRWVLPTVLVVVVVVGLLVSLGYLCVMKRANGSLVASKRRRDLDEQLDSGLDADFDGLRFSTQNVQSISENRQSYAE